MNPLSAILRQQDSLRLTTAQADSIAATARAAAAAVAVRPGLRPATPARPPDPEEGRAGGQLAFLADFFAVVFFAVVFFAAAFLAGAFLAAGFLAAGFFAAGFFLAVAIPHHSIDIARDGHPIVEGNRREARGISLAVE